MKKLNKKEKIIISVVSAIVGIAIILGLLFGFNVFKLKNNYYTYKRVDGGYEITGYVGNTSQLIIPSRYNGLPVVGIGEGAFYKRNKHKNVQQIMLPNTLKYISYNAFRDLWSLKGIYIPKSVETIEDYAFLNCKLIKNIVFEEDTQIESIGISAFSGTKFMEDTVPFEGYIMTGDIALSSTGIRKSGTYTIPKEIRVLAADTFYANSSISGTIKVEEDGMLEHVSRLTFSRTSMITSIDFTNAKNLKTIGDNAFADSQKITTINLGDNLEKIKDNAFYNCFSLKTLNLGGGSVDLGKDITYGCTNLNNISFSADCKNIILAISSDTDWAKSAKLTLTGGYLDCTEAEALDKRISSLSLKENVSCHADALGYFKRVNSFELFAEQLNASNSSRKIGSGSITVTIFGSSTNSALTKKYQDILASVTSLTFNNISSICDEAFMGIRSLRAVQFKDDELQDVGFRVFYGTTWLSNRKANAYTCLTLGKTLVYLGQNATDTVVQDGITRLDTDSIYCSNVTLPASLEEIGDSAFALGSGNQIIFRLSADGHHGLKRINSNAFYKADIESITTQSFVEDNYIENGSSLIFTDIEYVGKDIFNKDNQFISNLNGVFGLTIYIGQASYDDNNLVVPVGVKVVADYACQNITKNITEIVLPSSVLYVGEGAFAFDSNIGTIEIMANQANFGKDAFIVNDGTRIIVRSVGHIYDLENILSHNLSSNEIYVPKTLVNDYKTLLPNSKLIGY